MRRAVRVVALVVSTLLGAVFPCFAAGTAELLADINPLPPSEPSSSAGTPLLPLGERLLFIGTEPTTGSEPWVSDGTFPGTRRLLDLTPGSESSELVWLGTVRQTAVFLRRLEGERWEKRYDLWRSDGTAAGTFPLYDAEPMDGECGSRSSGLAAVGGNRLVFVGRGPGGCGLWTTDGTIAGTRFDAFPSNFLDEGGVDELAATGDRIFLATGERLVVTAGSSVVVLGRFANFDREGPQNLIAAGSRLVFTAQAAEGGGKQLWISDGTVTGTRAVTRFVDPFPLTGFRKVLGNILYFTADDGTGDDLWQMELSSGEPRRMTDFIGKDPFARPLDSRALLRLGNRLVFPAREEGLWREGLWVSGGTPESTVELTGCPGGCPDVGWTGSLTQMGNRAIFAGNDRRLWVTDGTGPGTQPIGPVHVSSRPAFLLGKVFFVGASGTSSTADLALWRTDGTAAGTVRLLDLPRGSSSEVVAAGGRAFFLANLDDRSSQLYVSDGSPAGTRALTFDITGAGSFPGPFASAAAGAVFTAYDGTPFSSRYLWITDGTAAGTIPIRTVKNPASLTPTPGGIAFFRAAPPSSTVALWRSDGTETGTFPVSPSGVWVTEILAPYRNGVVFRVGDEEPIALWESDGTTAGTRPLVDLPADVLNAQGFRAFGSQLYFFARRAEASSPQLWVSNGTADGTRPVGTDAIFTLNGAPPMALLGGTLFFATRYGLWRSDGSAAGTVELMSVDSEEGGPTDLTEFQGVLYFMAGTPESSEERGLWRTDGTPAGTVLIKTGGVPEAVADPARMVRLGDRLVFLADDGQHGIELWASDGTAAGTALVRDILPGEGSAIPSETWRQQLTVAGGRVFFTATNGADGFELWESDGTTAGTRRVQDIAPGALSSNPDEVVVVGNRLFFAADDGVHGMEPWVLALDAAGCAPSATVLCLGGRFRVEADWRDFQGNRGQGRAAMLTADTGTFWFFDAANVEVILKVLDGRGLNGHHWVFYGALSNVEYILTVTDTQTGAVRRYFNPPGTLGSVADTEAFGPRGASLAGVVTEGPAARRGEAPVMARSASAPTAAAGGCTPGATRLCLQDGRFAVEARWTTQGQTGTGKAVPLAGGDTGYFWFFDANNVEVVLKVLDGRPLNSKLWVFYGALSDVEYTLTVTDTETGVVKTYTNPKGRLASVADTGAF